MNPAGWVPHPDNDGSRLYFSRFRPHFTDAGFEVVDCPRLSHTKNGADIRMVIDAVEALRADVRYDEFVVASGDSDMTPLIVRLRASDRRTTLLSPSDSAVVLGAVADNMIGAEEFLGLLDEPGPELEQEDAVPATLDGADAAPTVSNATLGGVDAKVRFSELVADIYAKATEPINLAGFAHDIRGELGQVVTDTRWFGYGGFARAIQALQLPGVRMSQHDLWDSTRHDAPPTEGRHDGLPEGVSRVTQVLRLPVLPANAWHAVHESLAAFVAAYEFKLTEATRWARDRLIENGYRVNRQTVGVVTRGAAYGGCPLYRQPPPNSNEIGEAFATNILSRAGAADVELSPEDVEIVRRWFGVGGLPDST